MNSDAWQEDKYENVRFNSPSPDYSILTPLKNSVSVYIGLKILLRMRAVFGLEAMLQYMERYVRTTSQHCPELAEKTDQALKQVQIENLFLDF